VEGKMKEEGKGKEEGKEDRGKKTGDCSS